MVGFALVYKYFGVAMEYRVVDRDQLFLLPPSMRDWLPDDHLALLVEEVVAQMDTRVLHRRARLGGVGRSPYHPDMIFGLLVYAYADGTRSSRQIEAKCHTDIAYRYLCAQDIPDHSVIARFRRAHAQALTGLLTEVLVVAVRLGMGRFGHVAIDGTKIAASASRDAHHDVKTLQRMADEWMTASIAVDDAEDADPPEPGDRIPPPPPGTGPGTDRTGRAARIAAALAKAQAAQAEIDAETASRHDDLAAAKDRLDTARATQQARVQAWEHEHALPLTQRTRGHLGGRPGPVESDAKVRAAQKALAKAATAADKADNTRPAKANSTDPDARLLQKRGGGYLVGYNCQLAVGDDQLILAVDIHDNPHDAAAFIPMMNKTLDVLDTITTTVGTITTTVGLFTADAGYDAEYNLTAPGPDRLIAQNNRRRTPPENTGHPPENPTPRQHMAWRLTTPQERTRYKRRAITVEPVNGHLKDRIGLRQFLLRGNLGATLELTLAAIAHNIRKIHTHLHPA